MEIISTKTEKKIVIYIKNNQNRNRPLTRGSIAKELKAANCLIYNTANLLLDKGVIKYTLIDKRESRVELTQLGEEQVCQMALVL